MLSLWNRPNVPLSKFWEEKGATGFSLPCSSRGKTLSMSSGNHPSTSGRHSFTTPRGQVRVSSRSSVDSPEHPSVREILSELIDQLVKLVSSEEFEQQEVCPRKVENKFPLNLCRPPLELPRNCARSPGKSCWQILSWFSRSALPLRMQGQGLALVCCLRNLCAC